MKPELVSEEKLKELWAADEADVLKATPLSGKGLPYDRESYLAGGRAAPEDLEIVQIQELRTQDSCTIKPGWVQLNGAILVRAKGHKCKS